MYLRPAKDPPTRFDPSPEINRGGLLLTTPSPVLKERNPQSGRFESLGVCEETDSDDDSITEGEDSDSHVSMRTVWKAKDLHSRNGYQGGAYPDSFFDELQKTKVVSQSHVQHALDRHPQKQDLLDQLRHEASVHELPSSLPSKQQRRQMSRTKTQCVTWAMKEARIVEAEDRLVLEYIDLYTMELNLHSDDANFHETSNIVRKSVLVVQLIRKMQKHWLDPGCTVERVANEHHRDFVPERSARKLMDYFHDYRCNNCTCCPSPLLPPGLDDNLPIMVWMHDERMHLSA